MLEIETARLKLRQFTADDEEALAQILSDPEVMRYSPSGSIPPEKLIQVTQGKLEFFINHWEQHDFGVWAAINKITNDLIGFCGLNFLLDGSEVEVLYRFAQAYWNRGIATEATLASLRYGFEQVKLNRIVALTLSEHTASRRVMEKAGLKYEKDAHLYSLDVVYYAISRTAWQPDDFFYVLVLE